MALENRPPEHVDSRAGHGYPNVQRLIPVGGKEVLDRSANDDAHGLVLLVQAREAFGDRWKCASDELRRAPANSGSAGTQPRGSPRRPDHLSSLAEAAYRTDTDFAARHEAEQSEQPLGQLGNVPCAWSRCGPRLNDEREVVFASIGDARDCEIPAWKAEAELGLLAVDDLHRWEPSVKRAADVQDEALRVRHLASGKLAADRDPRLDPERVSAPLREAHRRRWHERRPGRNCNRRGHL